MHRERRTHGSLSGKFGVGSLWKIALLAAAWLSIDWPAIRAEGVTIVTHGSTCTIYARITDGSRTRYLYAAPVLRFNDPPSAGHASSGTCIRFDGTDDYVDCGASGVLMPTAAITVEAWIYANAWTTEEWRGTIVGKDQMGPDSGWVLRTGDNGRATFVIANSANQWPTAMTAQLMVTGQWYHLAGTYDGNTIRTYINGVERASGDDAAAPGIAASACSVRIGASGGFPSRYFNGRIDDVRIWNVARTAAQIQADMNRGLAGNEPGLVGYWRFDEGSGTVANDATSNHNDGTLTNGPTWLTPGHVVVVNDNLARTVSMTSDSTVTLEGYDPDGDRLTASLTRLPAAGTGALYQYGPGGARGGLISTTPTTVLDSQMRVVYAPVSPSPSYNAVLRWKVNDGLVDSDNTATYTLTVPNTTPPPPEILVDKDSPGPVHDGRSWATAYLTIGAAIADSGSTTAPIWVANGTYNEAITLQNSRKLYGGFQGYGGAEETTVTQRNWTANPVVIDGSTARSGSPAYHVVTFDGVTSTTLDGFGITGGVADNSTWAESSGGGIWCINANASNHIANCRIYGNSGVWYSGGAFWDNSRVAMTDCEIMQNTCNAGGGLGFMSGSAPDLTNCRIHNNSVENWGGGLYCTGSGVHPRLTGCEIRGNMADSGGGMQLADSAAATLVNCVLSDNSGGTGGAVCVTQASATLIHCTISGNSGYSGGALWMDSATCLLRNCIMEGNSGIAIFESSGSGPTLDTCLFYNNPDGAYQDATSRLYLDSETAALNADRPKCTGNLCGDPAFRDRPGSDFHLTYQSAAVDTGTSASVTTDKDGVVRPIDIAGRGANGTGREFDIGAYEYVYQAGAVIALWPESVDFGKQGVNRGPMAPRAFVIKNNGAGALVFTSIGTTGSPAFSPAVPPDTSNLASGTTRTVSVRFDPSAVGVTTGTLRIVSNAINTPTYNAALRGEGINTAPLAGLPVAGSALHFDGANYVNAGSGARLTTNSLSWSFWARRETADADQDILYHPFDAGGSLLAFFDYEYFYFRLYDTGGNSGRLELADDPAGWLNEWHHWAGTYDGLTGRMVLYLDGVAVSTDTTTLDFAPTTGTLFIGGDDGGYFFTGQMDEVHYWRRPLTPDEIRAGVHRRLRGGETGLIGCWRFDEGAGMATADLSPNGNNGALTTGTTWVTPSTAPIVNDDPTTTAGTADKVLTLDGVDIDSDVLAARVAQLPAAGKGHLYQYGPGGARGAAIASVPAPVSDAQRRVLYAFDAQPTTYSAVVRWKVNDGLVDSDNTATYTLTVRNVLPATPVMMAEPAWTAGTQNTVFWNAVTDTTTYTVQCDDARDFLTPYATAVVSSATLSRTFTALTNGRTYWYRVDASNGYGTSAWSAATSSTQDAAPPTAPGTPTDAGAYTSSTSVRFNWTAASDGTSGSGVVSYDLQVGTTPGGSNIFNANVGNVLTRTVTGTNGQTLYARVRAHDAVGYIGTWSGNSDGILIDTVPPGAPGRPTDAGAFTSSTSVRFNWTAAADPGGQGASGIRSYELWVGTTLGANNVFKGDVGNVLSRVVTGSSGQTLYGRVRALDRAGNVGAWSGNSNGITIDTVKPRLANATAPDWYSVIVTFNEPVQNADKAANYSCSGGLAVVGAKRDSDTQYRLTTSRQKPGMAYTLTVSTTVKDRAGNPLDSNYRSRTFSGGRLTAVRSWSLYR